MLVVVDASMAKAGDESSKRTASGSVVSPSDPMPVRQHRHGLGHFAQLHMPPLTRRVARPAYSGTRAIYVDLCLQSDGVPDSHLQVNRLMVPTGPLHYVVATVNNTDILTVSKEKLKVNVLQVRQLPLSFGAISRAFLSSIPPVTRRVWHTLLGALAYSTPTWHLALAIRYFA